MRKDEGLSKTVGKLGRILLRNTQPIPLTSCPAGSFPSLWQRIKKIVAELAVEGIKIGENQENSG
jgi:hypothetical protein